MRLRSAAIRAPPVSHPRTTNHEPRFERRQHPVHSTSFGPTSNPDAPACHPVGMTPDLALDDLALPDMEQVYRIAAARVTDAAQRGKVDLALRWARILNLALRDRQMRARLPVTADEVRQRLDPAPERLAAPPLRPAEVSPGSHSSHPVFAATPALETEVAQSPPIDRRRTFREDRWRC